MRTKIEEKLIILLSNNFANNLELRRDLVIEL
jgi:hypothetical protein